MKQLGIVLVHIVNSGKAAYIGAELLNVRILALNCCKLETTLASVTSSKKNSHFLCSYSPNSQVKKI